MSMSMTSKSEFSFSDLEDNIADSIYINTITSGNIPVPTKPWIEPSKEQLKLYHDSLSAQFDDGFVDATYLCSRCLGFYLFFLYCRRRIKTNDTVHFNFITDLAIFRMGRFPNISNAANIIISSYLTADSAAALLSIDSSNNTIDHSIPSSGPLKDVPPNNKNKKGRVSTPPDIARILSPSSSLLSEKDITDSVIDHNVSNNALHLRGPALDKILVKVAEIKKHEQQRSNNTEQSLHIKQYQQLKNQCYALSMFDDIDRVAFQYLIGKYFDGFKNSYMYDQYHRHMAILYVSSLPLPLSPPSSPPSSKQQTSIIIDESDYVPLRVLGRGGFGMVYGCKRAYSGKVYALKVMNKKRVAMKESQKHCLLERQILAMIDSPYVTSLRYAYATQVDLFLVLDLMVGGDLAYHLTLRGQFNELEARYLIARVLMGLIALHDKRIVYRDLKPANILMDGSGRTKLSDFGLATFVDGRVLVGACGTFGYKSPDMLCRDSQGHRMSYGLASDCFALGIVFYTLVYGSSPFLSLRAQNWGQNNSVPAVQPRAAHTEEGYNQKKIDNHHSRCNAGSIKSQVLVIGTPIPAGDAKDAGKVVASSESTIGRSRRSCFNFRRIHVVAPSPSVPSSPVLFSTTKGRAAKSSNKSANSSNRSNCSQSRGRSISSHKQLSVDMCKEKDKESYRKNKQLRLQAIDRATLEMEPDFDNVLFERDPVLTDLLKQLLEKDPQRRLGGRNGEGIREVMKHEYFTSINFESLNYITPPYIPPFGEDVINAASQKNIGSFTADDQVCATLPPLTATEQLAYKDWQYTSIAAAEAELVEFLKLQEEFGGPILPEGQMSTSCCRVS